MLSRGRKSKKRSLENSLGGKKGPSRKSLTKQLDILVDQVVYLRDKDTCQKCGQVVSGQNRHGSHVIPVSQGNKLRWEPLNLKVLCMYHHLHWWHKDITAANEWFKAKFPERWEKLQSMRGIAKFYVEDLIELKEKLTKQLKDLEGV